MLCHVSPVPRLIARQPSIARPSCPATPQPQAQGLQVREPVPKHLPSAGKELKSPPGCTGSSSKRPQKSMRPGRLGAPPASLDFRAPGTTISSGSTRSTSRSVGRGHSALRGRKAKSDGPSSTSAGASWTPTGHEKTFT